MTIVRMTDLDLAGKRVLIRQDLNVPVSHEPGADVRRVPDHGRIPPVELIAQGLGILGRVVRDGRDAERLLHRTELACLQHPLAATEQQRVTHHDVPCGSPAHRAGASPPQPDTRPPTVGTGQSPRRTG